MFHRHPSMQPRRALSLVEMLIATTVMAVIAVSLASVSMSVEMGAAHADEKGDVTQRGRVALSRVNNAMDNAHGTDQFPGYVVFPIVINGQVYPDCVVIWSPDGAPADPVGLPLYSELVMFFPHATSPNQLLEVSFPGTDYTVPDLSQTALWEWLIAYFRTSSFGDRVVLTDRLRTATVKNQGTGANATLGCIRFEVMYRPTDTQWNAYLASSQTDADWAALPWPQSIFSNSTGIRQAWCRTEMQLNMTSSNSNTEVVVPFFGSAALHYQVPRP